jgi:hypothetical protein
MQETFRRMARPSIEPNRITVTESHRPPDLADYEKSLGQVSPRCGRSVTVLTCNCVARICSCRPLTASPLACVFCSVIRGQPPTEAVAAWGLLG